MYGVFLWEMFEASPGEVPWGRDHNRSTVAAALLERGMQSSAQFTVTLVVIVKLFANFP